jgi:hypothetical protein
MTTSFAFSTVNAEAPDGPSTPAQGLSGPSSPKQSPPRTLTGSLIAGSELPSAIVSASWPSKAAANLISSRVPVEKLDSSIAARSVHLPPAVRQPPVPGRRSASSAVLSTGVDRSGRGGGRREQATDGDQKQGADSHDILPGQARLDSTRPYPPPR